MKAAVILVMLGGILALACAPPPPKFGKSPGEQEKTLVRTIPQPYDAVWRGVQAVVDSYRVHTMDRDNGLVLTWWNQSVVKQNVRFSEGRNFSHGIKIQEHSDIGPPSEGADFEIQKRLRINAIPVSDSSTTVTVAYYFKVTPFNLYRKHGERFGNKSFSIWEFDTREEFRIMDKIEKVAAKATSP